MLIGNQRSLKEATAFLRQATARLPFDKDILFNLAVTQQEAGKFEEALETYERVTDLDPRYINAYTAEAALLARCGRLKAALEELNRALRFADAAGQATLKRAMAEVGEELRQHPENPMLQVASCN